MRHQARLNSAQIIRFQINFDSKWAGDEDGQCLEGGNEERRLVRDTVRDGLCTQTIHMPSMVVLGGGTCGVVELSGGGVKMATAIRIMFGALYSTRKAMVDEDAILNVNSVNDVIGCLSKVILCL